MGGMITEETTPETDLVSMGDVTKEYTLGKHRVRALDSITLAIARKEFVILTGPSGSGKSSLLHLIGCLDLPTSGHISIDGKNVLTMNDRELSTFRSRTLGFVFQSFNLIPVLSAKENVEYPLRLQKLPSIERRRRTEAIIESVGLADFSHHRPGELSGGQRQRVAVARALVTNPRLVLADEPTANLDTKTGEHIIELMIQMQEKLHTSFLVATHDPMMARHAGREWHMRDGKLHNP